MIFVAVRIGPLMKDIFFVKPYILYFTTNKHTNEQEHAKGGKCIVFTQTKREADKLSYGMERSFKCQALHGDISQSQRERTLMDFREGRINILIATDVAARGLDIPNVDLVCFFVHVWFLEKSRTADSDLSFLVQCNLLCSFCYVLWILFCTNDDNGFRF